MSRCCTALHCTATALPTSALRKHLSLQLACSASLAPQSSSGIGLISASSRGSEVAASYVSCSGAGRLMRHAPGRQSCTEETAAQHQGLRSQEG